MRALAPAALLALWIAGCGSAPQQLLRIGGGPRDALVHVNDRYVDKLGRLEKRGIKLEAGEYRVTIDAVGYFPHDQIVVIDPLTPPEPLHVELEEVPD